MGAGAWDSTEGDFLIITISQREEAWRTEEAGRSAEAGRTEEAATSAEADRIEEVPQQLLLWNKEVTKIAERPLIVEGDRIGEPLSTNAASCPGETPRHGKCVPGIACICQFSAPSLALEILFFQRDQWQALPPGSIWRMVIGAHAPQNLSSDLGALCRKKLRFPSPLRTLHGRVVLFSIMHAPPRR